MIDFAADPRDTARICRVCNQTKPRDEFPSRGRICRACKNKADRQRQRANPKKMREYARRYQKKCSASRAWREQRNLAKRLWRVRNPEKARAQRKARYWRNPELHRARTRAYRARDPERERERWRVYKAAHRDEILTRRRAKHNAAVDAILGKKPT